MINHAASRISDISDGNLMSPNSNFPIVDFNKKRKKNVLSPLIMYFELHFNIEI